MACLFIFALYLLIKKEYTEKYALVLPLHTIISGIIALAVFLWLTGQGGFFFQYSDNKTRNAVLFDLINYEWPLVFERTGNAMSYYLLHWLVPALVGKVTSSMFIGRVTLYCWTLLGVILVILLLATVLGATTKRKFTLLILIFFSWSGISIIGGVVSNIFGLIDFDLNTYRWWTSFGLDGQGYGGLMFRSNCDQLASVYNQTISPWLAIPLLVNKPKLSTFVFLGACVFAYSPLPFIGVAAIMIFHFIQSIVGEYRGNIRDLIIQPFSIYNIIAALTVVPVFLLFYSCNISATTGAGGHIINFYIPLINFNIKSLLILLLFYFLQFGIYVILIHNAFKWDRLFRFISIVMCIIPLIQLGAGGDFCWNVSAPFSFLLMMYCIKYIFLHVKQNKGEDLERETNLQISKSIVGLIICFSFSVLDPFTQIAFGFKIAYQEKTFDLMIREMITFSDKTIENLGETLANNYLVPNYEETIFFKYLAHPVKATVSQDLIGIACITNLADYLDFLSKKNITMFIAVQDIQGFSLCQEYMDKFKALGFSDNVERLLEWEYHSFVGIVNNGEIVTEQIGGDEYISYSTEIDGYPVNMESATLNTGNFSTINISGQEYSSKGRGLNIVVRDNLTGYVIDSVSFDTHADEIPCVRMELLLCKQ